jgi:nitroreductase
MQSISERAILDSLQWRYAVKAFDAGKKIPDATWSALEDALVLSPSSFGLQPWKFVVVKDAAVRAKLRPLSWNQSQITDASHLVVLCAKTTMTPADVDRYVDRIHSVRGGDKAALAGYRDMMLGSVNNPSGLPGGNVLTYTRSQTYIALGVFLSACAMLGVDACPMEGFDPKGYDEVLGVSKSGFMPVVVAAAGYRSSSDWLAGLKKVRYEKSDVISHVL